MDLTDAVVWAQNIHPRLKVALKDGITTLSSGTLLTGTSCLHLSRRWLGFPQHATDLITMPVPRQPTLYWIKPSAWLAVAGPAAGTKPDGDGRDPRWEEEVDASRHTNSQSPLSGEGVFEDTSCICVAPHSRDAAFGVEWASRLSDILNVKLGKYPSLKGYSHGEVGLLVPAMSKTNLLEKILSYLEMLRKTTFAKQNVYLCAGIDGIKCKETI